MVLTAMRCGLSVKKLFAGLRSSLLILGIIRALLQAILPAHPRLRLPSGLASVSNGLPNGEGGDGWAAAAKCPVQLPKRVPCQHC